MTGSTSNGVKLHINLGVVKGELAFINTDGWFWVWYKSEVNLGIFTKKYDGKTKLFPVK